MEEWEVQTIGYKIGQQSPTFLSPGTDFVEDSSSTVGGGQWMVQVVMGAMVGMVQAVTLVMGNDGERQMKLHSLTCCSPPAVWPGS